MKSAFRLWPVLSLLSFVLLGAGARAMEAADEPLDDEVQDKITITGTRTTNERFQQMRKFVTKVGRLASRDFGFARLQGGACIRVQGTSPAVIDYLTKRLSQTVSGVGLAAQKPGCKPNIDILLTNDAKALAGKLLEERPTFFKPFGNSEGTTKGDHALSDFRNSDAAVRWWQVTAPVDRRGIAVVETSNPGEPPMAMAANSMLASGIREGLLGTLVIVDTRKLGDATWDQLADYLAFVTLAEVDPHVSIDSTDSILNLFGQDARAPAELSAWDKAYLRALYAMNPYLLPRAQKAELAIRLRKELDAQ